MKNLKISLGGLILLALLWTACFKDSFTGIASERTAFVTFAGRILDEYNLPIAGAQVSTSGEVSITDDNGVFRLPPLRLPAHNTILKVSKAGYFDFSRAYIVADHSRQNLTIQLLSKVYAGTFPASTGGKINLPGGASIVFPAGAVTSTEQVTVLARYLDPQDKNLPLFMPGDLRGINASGEEQSLSTFGMLAVELRSQADEELQLAAGKEADITVPIPGGQAAAAPATLPLWHYDNDQARWIEEGSAQKVGNKYVGKVKHFSFWNYDASGPSIVLSGKVYIEDTQHPLEGVSVWVEPAGNGVGWGCGHGLTDANGYFLGAVNKDVPLIIHLIDAQSPCGSLDLYTQAIGPFSQDAALPPIILQPSNLKTVNVTGRLLDCNNHPLQNGYALVQLGSVAHPCFADVNGNLNISFLTCNNPSIGAVIGYDMAGFRQSSTHAFSTPPYSVVLGDLVACQTIEEFIEYQLDGESFQLIEPRSFVIQPFTYIGAGDTIQNKAAINFNFQNDNQTGTFPLSAFWLKKHSQDSIENIQMNTTVTEFGVPGQHIAGSFSGTFLTAANGATHNISGSYRVKRQ